MKLDKILWWTIGIGVTLFLSSFVISACMKDQSWWDIFSNFETALGFVANLAIVAAVIRFITSETLDIKGIGKIKIRRVHSNIQDLTNLVSREFFQGKSFLRTPVLDAFYDGNSMEIISKDPDFKKFQEDSESIIRLNVKEETFEVKRGEIKTVDALINAVKYIYFDGQPLDSQTLKEIYRKWYKITN